MTNWREEETKGIDIKWDTDHLTNQQVQFLIEEELLADSYMITRQHECNRMLADLNISPINETSALAQKQILFEDPADTILRREKGEHLSFQQMHYIYAWHRRQGQSLSEIWKKASLSISTAKRIIAKFDRNADMSAIYKEVRCNKLIYSPAVSSEINNFIKFQSGSFIARDLQSHLKEKIGWVIPFQQIRKDLKEKYRLSYK